VAGPTLTPARYAFQAALGTDNMLYVAGGQTADTIPTVFADMQRFNYLTNSWSSLAPMPTPAGQVVSGAANGKVFVAGGFTGGTSVTNILRIYDIAANTWSLGAPIPASPGVEAAAGAVVNGKFFVMGGDDFTNGLNTTYIYDIATNTWTTGATLPDFRTNTYATAYNGMVYLYGGVILPAFTTVDTLLRYDPVANSWTNLGSAGTGGRGNYGAISPYGSGQLLITDGALNTGASSTSTHIYNVASNSFSVGPSMIGNRAGHAQGQLPDGRVIVVDGFNTATTVTSAVELLAAPVQCGTSTPTPPVLTPPRTATSPALTATPTNPAVSATATNTPTRTPTGPPTNTSTVTRTGTPVSTGTRTNTPTATLCPIQFTDVPNGSPFYPYVRCLACRGIVNGYPDGTFRPNNNVTRGQLSKMVSNSAGFSEPHTEQTFQDVAPGDTFYIYIERMFSRGYIGGYACGGIYTPCVPPSNLPYFLPDNPATRGQIAKIVSNGAGYTDPPVGQQFEDVAPGSTFYDYIYRLFTRGIISGYPCGGAGEPCVPPTNRPYYRPTNLTTRGQASKIVSDTFFPGCQTPQRR